MAELWLENELTRQLRPVAAPDSLWDRIERGKPASRPRASVWLYWPVAAALVLTLASGMAWRAAVTRDTGTSVRMLAMEELRKMEAGGQQLDFRSEDPREIANWLKASAGIDVELPGGNGVRLLGACLVEHDGRPAAAIAYHAGGEMALLVVCGKGSRQNRGRHAFTTAEQVRVYSWKMQEQEYAIASSAAHGSQVACLLCHSQPQVTFN